MAFVVDAVLPDVALMSWYSYPFTHKHQDSPPASCVRVSPLKVGSTVNAHPFGPVFRDDCWDKLFVAPIENSYPVAPTVAVGRLRQRASVSVFWLEIGYVIHSPELVDDSVIVRPFETDSEAPPIVFAISVCGRFWPSKFQ